MFSRSFAFLSATALTATLPLAAHAQVKNTPSADLYDTKAAAILQRAADRLKAIHSLSGQVQETTIFPATKENPLNETRSIFAFHLQKPGFVFQEYSNQVKATDGTWKNVPTTRFISDGKTGASFSLRRKTYRSLGTVFTAPAYDYELNFMAFFDPKQSDAESIRTGKAAGQIVSLKCLSDQTFAGVDCAVVTATWSDKRPETNTVSLMLETIYVGKKDGIIRGWRQDQGFNTPQAWTYEATVTNVAIDRKTPASTFAVDLTGYKKYVEPKRPPLLTAGTVAPDFTAYNKDGKAVKLSDYKGKMVVLDFWATWCGPCMASLPHTADVAKKTADKGVVVLAVNVWDTKDEFDKWLPKHPEFSPLVFAIDTTPGQGQDVATKLYKVSGIPTQYVIGRDGMIVASFVGFSGPADALEKAIEKADANNSTAKTDTPSVILP